MAKSLYMQSCINQFSVLLSVRTIFNSFFKNTAKDSIFFNKKGKTVGSLDSDL